MKRVFVALILLGVLAIGFYDGQPVMAQENCLPIVEQALDMTSDACSATGRNEICYGNMMLYPDPQPNTSPMFEKPGDITAVDNIRALILSPLVPDTNVWGVAVMRLQANMPGTLPGQIVTVVLFGNVMLEDVEVDSTMSFQFTSGIGRADCTAAPENGLMISTPEGEAKVDLTVNGVDVSLGSTAFFQAVPGETMDIALLDGSAEVRALGSSEQIGFGQSVSVPMSVDMLPDGPPGEPEPFDADKLFSVLPVLNFTQVLGGEGTGSSEPCRIYAPMDDTFGVHVGPGENRSRIAWLKEGEYVVTGQNGDWWQLPKEDAAPSKADAVNETWVKDDGKLEKLGNCDNVEGVSAPPIIPITAPKPTPTQGAVPGPRPDVTVVPQVEPVVQFWADSDYLDSYNECTMFHVSLEFASRASFWTPYYNSWDEVPISESGQTMWDHQVCPPSGEHNFVLRVYRLDGSYYADYNYVIIKY